MERRRQHILHTSLFALLGISFVALAIADMFVGSEAIPMREVITSLWGEVSAEYATIIYKIRMPKVIVAIFSGMVREIHAGRYPFNNFLY